MAFLLLLALLRPLQESRHYIRTAYGDSSNYYGGKRPVPFQGTGQGNASSSPFWIIISTPLITFMRSKNVCSTFTTAITLVSFSLIMVLYVDDNDIFVTSDRPDEARDILQRAQKCITMWKETLNVTGGVVRPIKCSWVFVDFDWDGPNYKYKPIRDLPGSIYLENDQNIRQVIERKEPWVPVKNLGIHTVVTGCEDDEITYQLPVSHLRQYIHKICPSPIFTTTNTSWRHMVHTP